MNKKRFFYSLPFILLLIVAVVGWFTTDYLGNQAQQEIIGESQASVLTLSTYVSDTLKNIEGATKSLAGSPRIPPALMSKRDQDIEQANIVLDRDNSAFNASVSYLMTAGGMTVASSNRKDPDSFVGKSYRFRPYFQEAAKGNPGRYFGLGITSGKRGFYASCPVQNRLSKVLGVVTMKKDIDEMETFFSQYPFCFLISPEGIIFLSSSPAMVLRSLWPLDKTVQDKLIASQQFGNKLSETVFKKEIADGMEVTLEGKDYLVSRMVIGSDGWSIVLLTPTGRIRVYQLIGILATIGVCSLILIFSGIIYVINRSREAIRQSEELYKALAEKSIAGVYVVQDGKFRFINANAASYAGYTREELLGQEASLLVSPEDMEKVKQNAKAMLRGEISSPYEFRIITKQGETRWIMETVTSILHNGRPAILGNSMDITESKQAEEVLRERDIQFKKLSSWVPGMIYQFTKRPDGTYCMPFTTEAIKDIFGCSPQDVREDFSPIAKVILPEDFDKVIDSIEYSAKHLTIWTCEYRVQIPGQSIRWMLGHSTPEKLADGSITWHGFITDITERKQVEQALQESEDRYRELSIIDNLTQLYNSRYFYHQLKMEIDRVERYGQPLTLLLLDLDDFKQFNDTYGHIEGDQVLSRFGQVVKRCLRQTDSAYRYGGEEFTILLPMTTSGDGAVTAERIRAELKEEIFFPVSGKDVYITVSIGLAQYKSQEDMKAFVNRVDQLMYQAKKNGKDRVCSESY
jgi:diguanylate cyclase (GGDEF)-like protein/PAS domain S-box-containing protein